MLRQSSSTYFNNVQIISNDLIEKSFDVLRILSPRLLVLLLVLSNIYFESELWDVRIRSSSAAKGSRTHLEHLKSLGKLSVGVRNFRGDGTSPERSLE